MPSALVNGVLSSLFHLCVVAILVNTQPEEKVSFVS